MGMLRDRMEGDLKLRGFSPNTQRCYLNCAARFAAHYGRSPVLMGEREIRQFLLHLVKEEHASPATQRMFVASLKFLYVVTLRRPREMARVPFPKVPRRLPVVLTGSEAERVIACIRSIRHRTIAAVAYGAGLRIAEIRCWQGRGRGSNGVNQLEARALAHRHVATGRIVANQLVDGMPRATAHHEIGLKVVTQRFAMAAEHHVDLTIPVRIRPSLAGRDPMPVGSHRLNHDGVCRPDPSRPRSPPRCRGWTTWPAT